MDDSGSSSFYVIDKQTSSHIVWRCTYKSCSGRLKICRKDNKVISSKPHNHDIEPRGEAATNKIEKIVCIKMNKYVVVAAVTFALLVGAIIGGVVGHYSTLYKLGYYEKSPHNDDLSSSMAMMNGKQHFADGRTSNDVNNQDLVNQDLVNLINQDLINHEVMQQDEFPNISQQSEIFHDTHNENVFHENNGVVDQNVSQQIFSNDLINQDTRIHNTPNEHAFQQSDRHSLELVNSDSSSFNHQINTNNKHNLHNQGINHANNHPIQTSGINPRKPNEFQQNTHTNAIQNQANNFLNNNRGNAQFHHNTHHPSNHRFQLNGGNQNQREHNQHQQNIQRNINLQRQQTQHFNQGHFHGNTGQNIHQRQNIHGHSLNHVTNQQASRNVHPQNVHPQNVNRQQILPENIGEMKILFAGPSNQNVQLKQHILGHSLNHGANQQANRNANLQNVNRQLFNPVKEEEMEIVSAGSSIQSSFTLQSMSMIKEEDNIGISTTTTLKTPINTQDTGIPLDQSSPQRNEQTFLMGSENSDMSIIKASTIPINLSSINTNEASSKSLNAFPSTVTEKMVIENPILLENTKSQKENVRMLNGLNPNLNQNRPEIISKHPGTESSNTKSISDVVIQLPPGGPQSFSKVFGINIEDENLKPTLDQSSFNLNQDTTLSRQTDFNSHTDSALINKEGISMVTEGLSMAVLGLSLIDHNINPQNIDLKNKIDQMQDTISHINLPLSLNISHRFSLGASSIPHNSEGISFGFAKSQASLPTSTININTSPLEKKSVLVGKMPHQIIPTPLSDSFRGSNINQPIPSLVSPSIQGFNSQQLVPAPVSPQTQNVNSKHIFSSPAPHSANRSNSKQLIPTPLSPQNLGSNPRQLVPTPLSPQIQGSNPRQFVPTPLSTQINVSNPKRLVPTPLSPQFHDSNTKQIDPTHLSPKVHVSHNTQSVINPVSPSIQLSNDNIKFSSPVVTPPIDVPHKSNPTPISAKIGLASQLTPSQEHQAAQQQKLVSNGGEKVRSKAVHEKDSQHHNWSNSGKLTMEEIKNYILKSVSRENLRNNLKELSRLPHQAGSARERQLANLIKERFLSSGFDMAELVPYDVLLSKPDPTQNNRVSLHTEGGVGEEVWAAQSVILPNEELQSFSAYSPSGKVMTSKGEAVVYVNYGQDEDFAYLDSIGVSLSGRVVMARTAIFVSGMKLVERAASRGARGVIIYPDPAEVMNPGETTVYPNSTSLPGDAVQLKTIRHGQGDPLTPGWPSKRYSHRLLEENIKSLPTIPVQPISYNDARVILQKLGGPASPIAWHGDLTGISYNIGPTLTSDFAHLNLCLATYNQLKRTTIYNVIGTIKGDVEPDRYVILGNHRDAWAYGAIDPSSGTAQMLETAAVLGQLKAKGWRPRRTVVFASWGAEEFGKIGSTEWVEEHVSKLQERGVAYINVDICSTGPILAHAASPTLRDVLVNMAKLVPGMGSSGSVYDEWREYSLRVDKTEPKPWHLGTGTDFSAFSFFGGVPSMGMGFMRNSSENDVPQYPAYHTAIETFDLVDRFIDPGFTIHQGCSRLSSLTLVHLAESPVLPLDPHYLAANMEEALREMKRKGLADVLMGTLGVQTLPALEESILNFKMAANAFLTRLRSPIYYKDPIILRGVNDQLTRLEQKFLMPQGSEEKPWCRQAVFAPSPGSPFGKWGFPALKDLLNDLVGLVNLHGAELSQRHHLIEKHVSDLILMTDSATSSLNHLHII